MIIPYEREAYTKARSVLERRKIGGDRTRSDALGAGMDSFLFFSMGGCILWRPYDLGLSPVP